MEAVALNEPVESEPQIILLTPTVRYTIFHHPIRNKIYVIGGDYEMSCEVYDIKENKWSFISSYNSLLGNSLYSFSSAIAMSE